MEPKNVSTRGSNFENLRNPTEVRLACPVFSRVSFIYQNLHCESGHGCQMLSMPLSGASDHHKVPESRGDDGVHWSGLLLLCFSLQRPYF